MMRAIKPKKKMLMKKKKAAVRSKRKMMRRTESPGRIRICCRISSTVLLHSFDSPPET